MEDFPDQLSPILVKELRQGMRGRVFVGSLILLQVAMVFLSIFGLTAATAGESTAEFGGIYWALVGVPLLVVMPVTGLAAVAGERTANTLELLFLTRLTARRILLGKWLALMIQAVLLVAAVVPYGVLRYFLGSVSLSQELIYLGSMLFGAAILSAVAVGCSPLPVAVTRGVAIVSIVFGVWLVPAALFAVGLGSSRFMSFGVAISATAWWLLALAVGVVLIAVALEFGAGRIAPPAENHSTPIRLIALATLVVTAVFALIWPSFTPAPLILSYVLVRAVCVGVLCESPRLIPALYRPFVRLGLIGRVLGRVLYPGWPSGVFFTLLGGVLFFLTGRLVPRASLPTPPIEWPGALVIAWVDMGVVLLPFACLRLVWKKPWAPFLGFILFQIGTYLLFSISAVVKAVAPAADPSFLFKLIPLYGLTADYAKVEEFPFLALGKEDSRLYQELPAAAFVTGIALVLLVWRMLPAWREIARCEQQAADAPAPAPAE